MVQIVCKCIVYTGKQLTNFNNYRVVQGRCREQLKFRKKERIKWEFYIQQRFNRLIRMNDVQKTFDFFSVHWSGALNQCVAPSKSIFGHRSKRIFPHFTWQFWLQLIFLAEEDFDPNKRFFQQLYAKFFRFICHFFRMVKIAAKNLSSMMMTNRISCALTSSYRLFELFVELVWKLLHAIIFRIKSNNYILFPSRRQSFKYFVFVGTMHFDR